MTAADIGFSVILAMTACVSAELIASRVDALVGMVSEGAIDSQEAEIEHPTQHASSRGGVGAQVGGRTGAAGCGIPFAIAQCGRT